MEGELDEGFDELEWWMIQSCGISKDVSGGGIINGEVGGKFLTGDLIEKLKSRWK